MSLELSLSSPSPALQTAVYMGAVLVGYLLLTTPAEWARVRDGVRQAWADRFRGS